MPIGVLEAAGPKAAQKLSSDVNAHEMAEIGPKAVCPLVIGRPEKPDIRELTNVPVRQP